MTVTKKSTKPRKKRQPKLAPVATNEPETFVGGTVPVDTSEFVMPPDTETDVLLKFPDVEESKPSRVEEAKYDYPAANGNDKRNLIAMGIGVIVVAVCIAVYFIWR